MTTYYLNNVDGSNTSPYDTMAKGAASMATLDGLAAAGDTILCAHDHDEDLGGTTSLNFSAGTPALPVKIISVNRTTEVYQAGATIDCRTGYAVCCWLGNIRVFGIYTGGDAGVRLCYENPGKTQEWYDCKFSHLKTSAQNFVIEVGIHSYSGAKNCRLVNCTLDWSAITSGFLARVITETGINEFDLIAPVFAPGSGSTPGAVVTRTSDSYGIHSRCRIRDADLSFMSTNPILSGNAVGLTLERCKIPASYVLKSSWSDDRGFVRLENCEDGTISAPALGLTSYTDYYGTCESDPTNFRTGGANDGTTDYSFKLVATTNTTEIFQPVVTPDMAIWVEAGDNQTVTVYFAGSSDRDDDELWIEVHSPNETDSPNTTAQGRYQSTRCDPNATPTALSRSSSTTWDGAGTGTDGGTGQQYAQVTISPAVAGWVIVRACLANKASGATVYVDPFPVVA